MHKAMLFKWKCVFQVGLKMLFTGTFESYRLDLGKLNLGRIHFRTGFVWIVSQGFENFTKTLALAYNTTFAWCWFYWVSRTFSQYKWKFPAINWKLMMKTQTYLLQTLEIKHSEQWCWMASLLLLFIPSPVMIKGILWTISHHCDINLFFQELRNHLTHLKFQDWELFDGVPTKFAQSECKCQ